MDLDDLYDENAGKNSPIKKQGKKAPADSGFTMKPPVQIMSSGTGGMDDDWGDTEVQSKEAGTGILA